MHAWWNEKQADIDQATDYVVALSVAYVSCTADLVISAASAGAERLLGWSGPSCIGLPLTTVCLPFIGSECELTAVCNGAQPHVLVEQVNIEHNEAARPRYISLIALPHPPGVLVMVSDVTRQSEQQQRLQQQHHELRLLHEQVAAQNEQLTRVNAQLLAVSQQKTDMLSMATHDLRSPLTTVIGFADMLESGMLGSVPVAHQEPIAAIRRTGYQMLEIINKFLDLRRLEAATAQDPKPIVLAGLAEQVVRSFADQAAFARVTLHYNVVADTMIVDGDPDVVQQALLNVVSNAIKYTGAGGTVTARLAYTTDPDAEQTSGVLAEPRNWCAIDIIDTGPGIAPADIARIFEPFFRTKSARLADRPGTGLGLAIVQRAMEQHNGRVIVTSELGHGTTVRLLLPCRLQRA